MKHFIQIICLLDYDFVFESHDARHYKTETMRELDEKFGNYLVHICNTKQLDACPSEA